MCKHEKVKVVIEEDNEVNEDGIFTVNNLTTFLQDLVKTIQWGTIICAGCGMMLGTFSANINWTEAT